MNALFACAFRAAACSLCSGDTTTSLRDINCTVGEETEEGGVDNGDNGGDDDVSLIVYGRYQR